MCIFILWILWGNWRIWHDSCVCVCVCRTFIHIQGILWFEHRSVRAFLSFSNPHSNLGVFSSQFRVVSAALLPWMSVLCVCVTSVGVWDNAWYVPGTERIWWIEKNKTLAETPDLCTFQMSNRQRGVPLGLLLLASQVFRIGTDNIPPATLVTLILNVYLFLFPFKPLLQVV